MNNLNSAAIIVTAGSNYLDIDAYACCVAMKELLVLKGKNAVAYSKAVCNYSICRSIVEKEQILNSIPLGIQIEEANYIIVDVSDPTYIRDCVPLEKVTEVYDHHFGFEDYWKERIGDGMKIEFIGAAATLIYREWKKANLQERMTRSTALLLIAAIVDNTLDLTSSNTTDEDRETFSALCRYANVDDAWRAAYFSEVQLNVEADLKNALFNDLKVVTQCDNLPRNVAQLCVWDAVDMLRRLPDIRTWLDGMVGGWMLNLIDIKRRCSYFVCDERDFQKNIERIFDVKFESGVAKTASPYLRKQILKNAINSK